MFKRANKGTISNARRLRRDATKAEQRLWWKLRELKIKGLHFRRQVPFQTYVLDFAEHNARLAIELDGGQHAQAPHQKHDAMRDRVLSQQGYLTLRFWNVDIDENLDGVVETILTTAQNRLQRPPPGSLCAPTSPHRGR